MLLGNAIANPTSQDKLVISVIRALLTFLDAQVRVRKRNCFGQPKYFASKLKKELLKIAILAKMQYFVISFG